MLRKARRYYTKLSAFVPIQAATLALAEFYSDVLAEVAPGGPSHGLLPTSHFKLALGHFWIEFWGTRLPITRTFIHQFLDLLAEATRGGFVGTFTASLTHAEADTTIFVQMGVE